MDYIYRENFKLAGNALDRFNRLKPSALLDMMQQVATNQCVGLQLDWDTMASKGLLWAVSRTHVQILGHAAPGTTITVETWPGITSRVAYPRSTVAYDEKGLELFRSISMWVLMDTQTRAMILPGKSGVTVQGLLTGTELAAPGSLVPHEMEHLIKRRVCYTDLDRNGHMNNTKYLEWMADLLPSSFHRENTARDFTVCYHSEGREGDELHMNWQLNEDGLMQVESWRESTEDGSFHRVFAAQVRYEPEIL